ncbi:helicase C-terminal domain-containing protein [Halalkalicoccus jeotgali]|uniref:Helicase c2 n=1 Tax=Halalkalicoccus jeotgali (strain DSM 18796 / CECT 7217 / JCM 14584 / KCTC 4019 / B3) TaxID=795797 RepID=D8J576_HALJB|nr:ATP-dependent DNA helicase [Halalkalicoccus jeotgali]ADJ13657.1 helicase c2 [Halalkalicoccus jeotgali B3]ELY34296.1 helicase c2 [Halalkalicoccus jeotgali B3]
MQPARIESEFPAPSHRGNQREALREIRGAFEAGNDVVLVRAPTGSGKSLLARAICGAARTPEEAEPSQATGAYYTTPQVSQLDDVATEPLLSDLQVIRGKGNYTCILPGEETTPVDRAPCARERGYDCAVRHRCPYFSDRAIASNRTIAAMTLAYFMQTAGSEVFRTRDVCVIDEAHGLADWAEMYATIDLGPRTVPMWTDLSVPEVESVSRAARYADSLAQTCTRRKDELLVPEQLTPEEAAERDRLQELIADLEWFVRDHRDPESPTTWAVDQAEDRLLSIKPMNPERYLSHTVWERANRFALLSATILDKAAFCRGVGLDPDRVALVDVGHTFPVENRPLFDVTQGRMTYDEREETIPEIARVLVRIMAKHRDEKGLVHAHSYAIQERLASLLADFGVGDRVRTHDREDRDAALEAWKESEGADVFLAVKMEEALDLVGDLARWQVLSKAPYLNTRDSRVAHRLERGQWAWYHRAALRTVIQACGRVVRSPEDYGATYLADSSLLDLFERTRGEMPPWFAEQVERTSSPDLPPFEASTGSGTGSPAPGTDRGTTRTPSGSTSSAERSNHPLSDVWGDG